MKYLRHIRSFAAIAVLFSEHDHPQHRIEAGRSYGRLALEAAALDLRTVFINQPVEVPALRTQLPVFSVSRIGGRTSSFGPVAGLRCRDHCGGPWSKC